MGIPSSYYQKYPETLTYNVLSFNTTNPMKWYIYVDGNSNHDIYRGYVGTNDGGKIIVNISSFADKSPELLGIEDNPVPYGNISVFKSGETKANFTADNISVTEMAYVFLLGYKTWFPGFLSPINWTNNANKAYYQYRLNSVQTNITIINTTSTVKYIFKQISGIMMQNTTLLYNRTNGVLLEAISNSGNYEIHIKIESNSQVINSYKPIILILGGAIGISVIWRKYYKKLIKK